MTGSGFYLKTGSHELKCVQALQLHLLVEVDRICRRHAVNYCLLFGTLLGQQRHGGFIPWDDDIDIGMTRENYNRFLKIAPKELGANYFLEHSLSENGCPYLFAKIKRNNTIYMEWCNRNSKTHHGVYIDIFPYDNLPDDDATRNKFHNKCLFINRVFRYRTTADRDVGPQKGLKWIIGAVLRRILHYLACLMPISFYVNWANKEFSKYNNMDTKYIACLSYGSKLTFERKIMLPVKQILFENQQHYIPNDVDKFLKILYGNYMELPPIEKRIGHLPYKVSID